MFQQAFTPALEHSVPEIFVLHCSPCERLMWRSPILALWFAARLLDSLKVAEHETVDVKRYE